MRRKREEAERKHFEKLESTKPTATLKDFVIGAMKEALGNSGNETDSSGMAQDDTFLKKMQHNIRQREEKGKRRKE